MAPPNPQCSETPCYTCRRRRVICDKAIPACQKCRVSGKQCLGYKKPLTWVRGVASRGKMMGLTFDDVAIKQQGEDCKYNNGERDCDGYNGFKDWHTRTWPSDNGMKTQPPQVQATHFSPTPGNGVSECVDDSYATEEEGNYPSCSEDDKFQVTSVRSQSSISPTLLDPILQDLDEAGRYYLSYYDTRFCRLMVLYDSLHENPYRLLIPLIQSSPLLFNAISAVAACHYMHSCNQDTVAPLSHLPSRSDSAHNMSLGKQNIAGQNIYRHVLMFKHRALRQLHHGLSELYKWSSETTLASILLLGHLELLDSGQGDWQIHVDGARRFIKDQLGKANSGSVANIKPVSVSPVFNDSLNTFLTGTCMTMDIMGSTLAPSGTWAEPLYSQLMRSPVLLSQIEQVMFIGCPSYLLRLILFIASLRHGNVPAETSTPNTAIPSCSLEAEISSVLKYIEEFDPSVWAFEMHSRMSMNPGNSNASSSVSTPSGCFPTSDTDTIIEPLGSFFHLATAYKLAIKLYATRVLLRPSPCNADLAAGVTELLAYLSRIPVTSQLFKCTIWPIFIAGAECRDPEQQECIQKTLHDLWTECLSMNIKVAARFLNIVWGRDEKSHSYRNCNYGTTAGVSDWIRLLDQLTVGWLFI